MAPGTPFGARVRALLLSWHHRHHVGFARLARMMAELFGLKISEGAIGGAFRGAAASMAAECAAIKETLTAARVIASDETTTRINGTTHWHGVFVSAKAVLHQIARSRGKAVARDGLGNHRPGVWVSDRYAGPHDLAETHPVCLAHVLRDVQYAIDCGDAIFAPRLRKLLLWAIAIGRRRDALRPASLATYHARAERRLDALVATPAAHPAGRELQAAVKAWRTKFFVFLKDREVPPTNNVSEREIRPSVVFRVVTGGFCSDWGACASMPVTAPSPAPPASTAKPRSKPSANASLHPPRPPQPPEKARRVRSYLM
jgi:transposase